MAGYNHSLINMVEFADTIRARTRFVPKGTVVDIGAFDGNDGLTLAGHFGITADHVHLIEPHPGLFSRMEAKMGEMSPHPNLHQLAVSNVDEQAKFAATDLWKKQNNMVSSLRRQHQSVHKSGKREKFHSVNVKVVRMDTFMTEHDIDKIDLLKIDVEGLSYEVLEGFGKRLVDVKAMHIEVEWLTMWTGQKLQGEVTDYLLKHGFVLVHVKCSWPQSDMIWVRRKLHSRHWWR